MKIKLTIILTSLAFLFTVDTARAATITVSPGESIQTKCHDKIVAGDTCLVNAGTYNERLNITRSGSSGKSITYKAQGKVVITKGVNLSANYNNIDGFETKNSEVDASTWKFDIGAGIYIKGSNNVVENNYIHDSSLTGVYLYGTASDQSVSNNIVRNNRIFQNVDTGISLTGTNNIIQNNEIWGTASCHPTKSTVGNCVLGMDANGITFHGAGHSVKNNYIHDINMSESGINPSIGDFNDSAPNDPHIDCFQTWDGGQYDVAGNNILFEGNHCNLLKNNAINEGGNGWMLASAKNITIRNNIVEVRAGVNGNQSGNQNITIVNNVFVNAPTTNNPEGVELNNVTNAVIKNNIFINQQAPILYSGTGVIVAYNMAWNTDGSTPKCIQTMAYSCVSPVPANNFWKVDPKLDSTYHPLSGSPVCAKGESGTYIGAYSCSDTAGGGGSGGGVTVAPTAPPKTGDVNHDNAVNVIDIGILIDTYGKTASTYPASDLNSDGIININDIGIIISNYGK